MLFSPLNAQSDVCPLQLGLRHQKVILQDLCVKAMM